MTSYNFLIFHKDHLLSLDSANSGAENATLWLAKTLSKLGHNVVVAGIIKEGGCQRWGIEFIDIGKNFDINIAFDWIQEKGFQYHLITACRCLPVFRAKNDNLCLSKGFIAHDPSGSASGIDPKILSSVCDYMICVSQAQKKLFLEAGADHKKIIVIPNGADQDFFKAGDPERRDYKKLIFVGALVPHKGIDILIQSFSKISQKHPMASLDIYGSASLWGQCDYIDAKDIQSKYPQINFFGAVNQDVIAKAFQQAGACIIPSRWFDSFPLTAVESLVSGCPVIAFNVGGISEAVNNDKNGILIDNVSEQELTNILDQILSYPDLLKRYSEFAIKNDRNKFSWDNFCKILIATIENLSTSPYQPSSKVGLVTTWNQQCGLATYASFLTSEFPKDSFIVLAESSLHIIKPDEPFVYRCWSKQKGEYSLLKSCIQEHNIKLLHLNCQARFFKYPNFLDFIKWCKDNQIKVVGTIHNVFSLEFELQSLLPCLDQIYVHCQENVLEAIANGARVENIFVVPHGVVVREPLSKLEKTSIRRSLGVDDEEKLITCFGFVQPHKGMETLIDTVGYLKSKGIKTKGLICGKPNFVQEQSVKYYELLQGVAKEAGVFEEMIFLNKFVSEDEVGKYLGASDVVLMNYRSQYFEASGACSLALGAGVPVVTSSSPTFSAFGPAVFKSTSGYPVQTIIEHILKDNNLRNTLIQNAKIYSDKYKWRNIANILQNHYRKLGHNMMNQKPVAKSSKIRKLKILINNRPNTFEQRGGDTVVIEKLVEGLKNHNLDVTIDLSGKVDPRGFDIVHIFNFALPDLTKFFATRAYQANVPFVVTTLLEDIPEFHYQSHYVSSFLLEYVRRNQDKKWWQEQNTSFTQIEKAKPFDNQWVAKNASALFTNGKTESLTLIKTYGDNLKIKEIPVGCELKTVGSRDDWIKEFGFSDFVLCVARLETRKNQLMLLKALENDDITVVLAGGGFSYQPEYEEAVRNFKRKGKTIILSKLTDQQLANAYSAAKVHVLPSWYELPGLVSLEAAYYGCNIVATKNGTAYDYLGEDAYYCIPENPDSIRSAVLAAYYAPRQESLKEKVMSYTWKQMADKTMQVYQDIASLGINSDAFTDTTITLQEGDTIKFQETLERGEILAKDHKFNDAIVAFNEALNYGPINARLARAHGATLLASGDYISAKPLFEQAIELDAIDAKSWCGLGMCYAFLDNREEAYRCQVKSLGINPENTVAILQLMESSYILNRYDDLEKILMNYLLVNPNDQEMKFCLAGCLYKAGKIEESKKINQELLEQDPNHKGALVLKEKLTENIALNIHQGIKVCQNDLTQPCSDISSANNFFSTIDQQILEAEECKRKKDFDGALSRIAKLFTESELTDKQKDNLMALKAEIYVLTERIPEAENIYDVIIETGTGCARALCGKGALAMAKGETEIAKEYFNKALYNRPNYDVALAGLGLCADYEGQLESAWNFYQRALSSNQENVRALLGLIETGYKLKRLQPVEEAIKQYLESHPADINFIYSLAGCCFAQGKFSDAIEAINTITLFEPNNANALELKSMIDKQLNDSIIST